MITVVIAAIALAAGISIVPSSAHADGTEIVSIPDANLKAAVNTALGGGRTPEEDVTVEEAERLTTLPVSGSVAELTGLQAFTNLTSLTLSPGTVSDLTPIEGLTNLTRLAASSQEIRNVAPLAGMTHLVELNLEHNLVKNLSKLPVANELQTLNLAYNEITNVAPIIEKVNKATLITLRLPYNKISDVSPLAPLAGGKVAEQSTASKGLLVQGNRIADFSSLSGWSKPPSSIQATGQSIYVGPYQTAGVNVVLKNDKATPALTVSPETAGSYDAAGGLLTLTDSTVESVEVKPNWKIYFTNAPVEAGEAGGPQVAGTPQVGEVLSVSSPGEVFAGTTCSSFSYRWLRDGQTITGNANFAGFGEYGEGDAAYKLPWEYMGAPGDASEYMISATDLGHQLSVDVTCDDTGVSSTSEPTALVTAAEAEQPVIQALQGAASFSPLTGAATAARSGVVGDPTNPTIPIYVGQLNGAGALVDPAQLVVTTSVETNAEAANDVKPEDVQVVGTGAERRIAITPEAATGLNGTVRITVTVTGTSGKTAKLTFNYVSSVQTTPTSRVLLGSSDASTAIPVGDGYMLVGDDEKSAIRLYDMNVSGREVAQFMPQPTFTGQETDIESSARKGDKIWWFGSEGNEKDGGNAPSRDATYETELTGTGVNAKITPVGVPYMHMRDDLIAWDEAHGNRFGFRQGTQINGGPEQLGGFDIEGAEFSPDGSELYLGFRAPLSPSEATGKALIVPVTNLEALTEGTATKATFGEPILLNLEGESIREIRKNARGEYLIIGGRAGLASGVQHLWAWNGEPETAPQKLTTVIPGDVEPIKTELGGAFEGIAEMPERLSGGEKVRLLMDQGADQFYGSSVNKKDGNDFTNKARTDEVELAGPVGTVADLGGSGSFPAQAANSIGAAQHLTVANRGSNILRLGQVVVEAGDPASVDDFLVVADSCAGKSLQPTESCTISLRFAPARAETTSDATLVVEGDELPDGDLTIPLTGTSTTLPKGEKGDEGPVGPEGPVGTTGPEGPAGSTGPDGRAGSTGPQGETGAQGEPGHDGAAGPKGEAGPKGDKGDSGPQGPAGRNGKDGSFAFAPMDSVVRARRGHTASLEFKLANRTGTQVGASATAPRGLGVRGSRSLKIAPLKNGQSGTLKLKLKVAGTAKLGTHDVAVRLTVGGKSVTRDITVQVTK